MKLKSNPDTGEKIMQAFKIFLLGHMNRYRDNLPIVEFRENFPMLL